MFNRLYTDGITEKRSYKTKMYGYKKKTFESRLYFIIVKHMLLIGFDEFIESGMYLQKFFKNIAF